MDLENPSNVTPNQGQIASSDPVSAQLSKPFTVVFIILAFALLAVTLWNAIEQADDEVTQHMASPATIPTTTAVLTIAPTYTADATTTPEVSPTPTTVLTPIHTPIPTPEGYELTDTRKVHTNPSGTYSVVLHQTTEPQVQARSTCVIYTEETATSLRVGLLDFVETQCTFGAEGLIPTGESFTPIIEWISDSEFVIDNRDGILSKYSLYAERSEFTYDKSSHKVIAVHDDIVILGTKDNNGSTNDETYSFYEFDTGSKLRDDWIVFPTEGENVNDKGLFFIEYDNINNGFFMVTREYPKGEVIYDFYWLPTDTLEINLLNSIGDTFPGGRGCTFGKLVSTTQGEITYRGLDCFILPQEYIDTDELRFEIPE